MRVLILIPCNWANGYPWIYNNNNNNNIIIIIIPCFEEIKGIAQIKVGLC